MIANLMLAAALTGVHTPETSKLFERRTDPESGVVSYSLVYGAPDDNRQSLYFVTKSMTEDGRFLVFNYTKGNETARRTTSSTAGSSRSPASIARISTTPAARSSSATSPAR